MQGFISEALRHPDITYAIQETKKAPGPLIMQVVDCPLHPVTDIPLKVRRNNQHLVTALGVQVISYCHFTKLNLGAF